MCITVCVCLCVCVCVCVCVGWRCGGGEGGGGRSGGGKVSCDLFMREHWRFSFRPGKRGRREEGW